MLLSVFLLRVVIDVGFLLFLSLVYPQLFLFALALWIEVLEQAFDSADIVLLRFDLSSSEFHWPWMCLCGLAVQWSVNSVKEDIIVIIMDFQSRAPLCSHSEESVIIILNLSIFILLCLCKNICANCHLRLIWMLHLNAGFLRGLYEFGQ